MERIYRWMFWLPCAWLLLCVALPLSMMVLLSISPDVMAVPPFRWCIEYIPHEARFVFDPVITTYRRFIQEPVYMDAVLGSIRMAALGTCLTLCLAFPIAYSIARQPAHRQHYWLVMLMIPFWTSMLVRLYAWIGIMKDTGLLNQLLHYLEIIDTPLHIMYTDSAVLLGLVYVYLPFMVLPIYAALHKIDPTLYEAAENLGAHPWSVFRHITLPLAKHGILSGCFLVFIPMMGEFVIPDLLGGSRVLMIGKLLWNEFFYALDWPMAATLAVVLTCLLSITLVALRHWMMRHASR